MGQSVRKAEIAGGSVWLHLGLVAVLFVAITACGGSGTAARLHLDGVRLHVLADWKGAESKRFSAVLRLFEKQTGAVVSYQAPQDGVPDELAALAAAGRLPDVAILPQPALLRQYADRGNLVPLDAATIAQVDRNYGPVWRDLGTVDGTPYGVWFKAADKSLIWYRESTFERAGVVPPASVDDLLALEGTLARDGTAAFAVGGGDGWTLTDLFENIYLRSAGPELYDRLAGHRLAWTDASVVDALRTFQRLLQPRFVAGGAAAGTRLTFEEAARLLTSRTPRAAMLSEADFVVGTLSGPSSRIGTDIDVFAFPAVHPPQPAVVAGGDVAVAFRKSPVAQAFMSFLATADAARPWAEKGGFLSPNASLDLSVYPDALTRSFARSLLEAGDQLRFDMSDQLPASFGSNEHSGLAPGLRALMRGTPAGVVAKQLEAAAIKAFATGSS